MPPIPTMQHICGVMRAFGYEAVPAPVICAGAIADVALAGGISLTIQIGKVVAHPVGGTPTLLIECALRLKGTGPVDKANRWTLAKMFPSSPQQERPNLSLQIDVVATGEFASALSGEWRRDIYRHVHAQIVDARKTLRALPVLEVPSRAMDENGLIVVVEVLAIADLAIGRSGLRKPLSPWFSAREVALRLAACDGLAYEILPDLAQAMRAWTAIDATAASPLSSTDSLCGPHKSDSCIAARVG
jgi:hypothetical protein